MSGKPPAEHLTISGVKGTWADIDIPVATDQGDAPTATKDVEESTPSKRSWQEWVKIFIAAASVITYFAVEMARFDKCGHEGVFGWEESSGGSRRLLGNSTAATECDFYAEEVQAPSSPRRIPSRTIIPSPHHPLKNPDQ